MAYHRTDTTVWYVFEFIFSFSSLKTTWVKDILEDFTKQDAYVVVAQDFLNRIVPCCLNLLATISQECFHFRFDPISQGQIFKSLASRNLFEFFWIEGLFSIIPTMEWNRSFLSNSFIYILNIYIYMITISCIKFTKLVSAGLSPPAENSNMFGTASAVACNCLYLPSIRMSKCFAISYKFKGFAIFFKHWIT